jgi:hypothetical protein
MLNTMIQNMEAMAGPASLNMALVNGRVVNSGSMDTGGRTELLSGEACHSTGGFTGDMALFESSFIRLLSYSNDSDAKDPAGG